RLGGAGTFPRFNALWFTFTAETFHVSLAQLTGRNVGSPYLFPAPQPLYGGKPRIWQLLPEQDQAWHAGVSFWRGATRLNATSTGMELENRRWRIPRGVTSFSPFTSAQIHALIPLPQAIIPPHNPNID
ncbi:N-acetylmuramoyl-L-alanine amidase, partial [Salmonella enterica]|uniref:N-acetylmuramoyl-L-alanine amidase n=1 Tax=Salmonella enterica TaxID=28901 RepID=UPI00398C7FE0